MLITAKILLLSLGSIVLLSLGVQLRCGPVLHLGWGETAVVLQDPPYLRPADATASPARSLQLRGWVRELASRLVCPEEGVVLQGPRKRLSISGRWVRDIFGALRLQCWVRQLAGWLEHPV